MTPEDVINNALEMIGSPTRIGSFYDGTREAVVARDTWVTVRDALLIKLKPEWARRDVALVITKTAPVGGYDQATPWTSVYPEPPWLYEYAYPEDCLTPLAIQSQPFELPAWRPRMSRFRIKPSAMATSFVLLGNEPMPLLTYIVRTPDTSTWYEDFTEVVIEAMAKKLMPLFGSKETMHRAAQNAQAMARAREQSDANDAG